MDVRIMDIEAAAQTARMEAKEASHEGSRSRSSHGANQSGSGRSHKTGNGGERPGHSMGPYGDGGEAMAASTDRGDRDTYVGGRGFRPIRRGYGSSLTRGGGGGERATTTKMTTAACTAVTEAAAAGTDTEEGGGKGGKEVLEKEVEREEKKFKKTKSFFHLVPFL
jgi:hypothetical protein